MAAAIEVSDVGLANDGDHGFFGGVFILGVGFLCVTGRSSGGDGQQSGNDKLQIEQEPFVRMILYSVHY